MKRFDETHASKEKLSPLVREIDWLHSIIMLVKALKCPKL